MRIILKNTSDQPLYQQIKDQIKAAILNGELKAGQQLPSIRALANDLQVSVLTTKRVYTDLEAEGFILSRVGKGSFVAPENLELYLETKRRMVEKQLADVCHLARQLGIKPEELHTMLDLLMEEENDES